MGCGYVTVKPVFYAPYAFSLIAFYFLFVDQKESGMSNLLNTFWLTIVDANVGAWH